MARPLLDILSGSELKNNTMDPAELKAIRWIVGAWAHRRSHRGGVPRSLSQKAIGRQLRPPVTDRTIRNYEAGATPIPLWYIGQLRKLKRLAMRSLYASNEALVSAREMAE